MSKIYTGIGSRDMPYEVRSVIKEIAEFLAEEGYTLRSGGADGCDLTFENVHDRHSTKKEIYIPWNGFSNKQADNKHYFLGDTSKSRDIASHHHKYWKTMSEPSRKLMARNTMQILGLDCETPTDFVVCYTKGGKMIGGTSQALRIALSLNIPIFNIGFEDTSHFPAFLIFYNFMKQYRKD